jgi:hypothetical protein
MRTTISLLRLCGPPAALAIVLALVPGLAGPAVAGGGWVEPSGHGYFQLGFSRKTADVSWDAGGEDMTSSARFKNHDFRYWYASGEVGLTDRLAGTFLLTYLDGREGPDGDLHRNAGLSDAWFGARYAILRGSVPLAAAFTVRTDLLYDIDGPYTLEMYDSRGELVGNSPEWRGLLKEDYSLELFASRSLGRRGAGWASLGSGYTWRSGAPADQVPFSAELGWKLPAQGSWTRGRVWGAKSLGNDSAREPDDRFGSRPGFNFNDASMIAAGLAVSVPVRAARSHLEIGYNRWIWGRSARQYQEPYLAWTRSL